MNSKPIFKRFWFWMLILLAAIIAVTLVFVLRGDGPSGDPAVVPGDVSYTLNEPAAFRELTITATDFQESEGEAPFLIPDAGNVFLGVRFEVENTSDTNQAIDQHSLFESVRVNGAAVQFSLQAALYFQADDESLDTVLEPGQRTTGWFAVETLADWDVLDLRLRNNWSGLQNATFVFGDEAALAEFETAPYVPELPPADTDPIENGPEVNDEPPVEDNDPPAENDGPVDPTEPENDNEPE